jgi:hypothetical protein
LSNFADKAGLRGKCIELNGYDKEQRYQISFYSKLLEKEEQLNLKQTVGRK